MKTKNQLSSDPRLSTKEIARERLASIDLSSLVKEGVQSTWHGVLPLNVKESVLKDQYVDINVARAKKAWISRLKCLFNMG